MLRGCVMQESSCVILLFLKTLTEKIKSFVTPALVNDTEIRHNFHPHVSGASRDKPWRDLPIIHSGLWRLKFTEFPPELGYRQRRNSIWWPMEWYTWRSETQRYVWIYMNSFSNSKFWVLISVYFIWTAPWFYVETNFPNEYESCVVSQILYH